MLDAGRDAILGWLSFGKGPLGEVRWRRERIPEVPDTPSFDLAPDWVCEAISRSTAA